MKINRILRYNGNAITREYKRNKHLTYFNAAAVGSFGGSSNVCNSLGDIGQSIVFAGIGFVFLKNAIDNFLTLITISKPYENICKRAQNIYKNQTLDKAKK